MNPEVCICSLGGLAEHTYTVPFLLQCDIHIHFFITITIILFYFLFIPGCAGSCLLSVGFLQLRPARCCRARAYHCGDFSCFAAQALGHAGLSSCSTQAQQLRPAGSRAWAQQWHLVFVVPWHMESSQTRDQSYVPCTGSRILIHCSTGEVHIHFF